MHVAHTETEDAGCGPQLQAQDQVSCIHPETTPIHGSLDVQLDGVHDQRQTYVWMYGSMYRMGQLAHYHEMHKHTASWYACTGLPVPRYAAQMRSTTHREISG